MNAQLKNEYLKIKKIDVSHLPGPYSKSVLEYARTSLLADELGLEVTWNSDDCIDFEYFRECFDMKQSELDAGINSGRFEVLVGTVADANGNVLSSLDGVFLDNNAPELERFLVGLELLSEAIRELKLRGASI